MPIWDRNQRGTADRLPPPEFGGPPMMPPPQPQPGPSMPGPGGGMPGFDQSFGQPPYGQPRDPQQEMMQRQQQHPLFGGQQQPPSGTSPKPQATNELDTWRLMDILNKDVLPQLNERFVSNLDRGSGVNDKLRNFYENAGLNDRLAAIDNSLGVRTEKTDRTTLPSTYYGGTTRLSEAYNASENTLPKLYRNLDIMADKGLPGQRQLENERDALGLGGMAGSLLGGQGKYGVNDALSQILTKGLPNQRTAEDITSGQASYGTRQQGRGDDILNALLGGDLTSSSTAKGKELLGKPVTAETPTSTTKLGTVGDRLLGAEYDVQADPLAKKAATRTEQALDQGGLTDEYVSASRNKILKPSTEALYSRLNKQGGGVSSLSSGLMAELDRRNEADFNDSLVMAGYKGYSDLLDKGFDYGAETYKQGKGNVELGLDAKKLGSGLASDQAKLDTDIALSRPKDELASYDLGSDLLADEYKRTFDTGKLTGDRGERALDRSLSGFQTVSDSAYPYLKMAGDLGTKYLDQSQNRFDSTSKYGLDLTDLLGKWGSYPVDQSLKYGLAERASDQAERGMDIDEREIGMKENQFDTTSRMNLLDMLLGGEQKYLTGEQAAGTAQNQQLIDILQQALKGEYESKMNPWWSKLL